MRQTVVFSVSVSSRLLCSLTFFSARVGRLIFRAGPRPRVSNWERNVNNENLVGILLSVVTIIAVLTVFVPSADGLSCYICRGDGSAESARRRDYIDDLIKENKANDAYRAKKDGAVPCTTFDSEAKNRDKYRAECPFHWEEPFCFASKSRGSGCGFKKAAATFGDELNMNGCNSKSYCVCNSDFCNTANNMNDASKRVVVTLLGVGYLVRGYFGSGGGF
ncbi:uncharacterized protein LOC118435249 [Folsomia candida]|uniref:uncharacterized protein LOC118435249 n=1 Tax=Folsomia candida TaxID=158441 RepID=UPI001604D7F8|nr:uncharacterized protein LOC118435249 [Folsomia candida]